METCAHRKREGGGVSVRWCALRERKRKDGYRYGGVRLEGGRGDQYGGVRLDANGGGMAVCALREKGGKGMWR